MKVTQVAILPTEASRIAGRPSLTPELLAASGARYSRDDEGLKSILSKIDPDNLDKSVDAIFRMIDYGHQSIADMAPISIFMDGISIWLAYYVWSVCPTAGGQESSTRYIRLSVDDLIAPDALGIREGLRDEWRQAMDRCVEAYRTAVALWEGLAEADSALAQIPRSLLDDPSERAIKQVARMRRNYGFDRARYFLPVAASTNVMLIMSARGWVQLCQRLLAHPLPEAQELGRLVREEMALAAPRMLKHAAVKASTVDGLRAEFDNLRRAANLPQAYLEPQSVDAEHPPIPSLEVMLPPEVAATDLAEDLRLHDNRYAWTGPDLGRTMVRFGWKAMAIAEIRDLNRHRTGTKYCPFIPRGFYCANDQLPRRTDERQAGESILRGLEPVGRDASAKSLSLLRAGDPSYVYWSVLGTQYPFEHTTTADKFIYEAELRTGTGAHYRYARHLHDVLALWFQRFPETRGLVIEGSAEPE